MYAKLKYIILTILILGIGFGIFSFYNLYENGYQTEFYIPLILVGLIIIFFFLPRNLKMQNKTLTLSALGISIAFLILTVNLTSTHFSNERYEKILTEYSELNCEEMKDQFTIDLKNDELKHFSGGFVGTGNLGKNLKKYDIEHFDLGCIIRGNLMCYSELVWDYLKKNENVEIVQLYE